MRADVGARGLTAGALANSSMVTSGAIINRLDRLVVKKLISRDIAPDNRRTVRIALTEAGTAVVNRALRDHVDNEEKLLSSLGSAQRGELEALLRQLLSAHEAATE